MKIVRPEMIGLLAVACAALTLAEVPMETYWRKLTSEEERVIVRKGTEKPFSGKYVKHHESGVYACRRCGAALYRSEDKFDSECGWPSFDAEVAGAVRRQADADGQRTEIVCASCGGHLGHVFNDGPEPTGMRYCMNSVSLDFQRDSEKK